MFLRAKHNSKAMGEKRILKMAKIAGLMHASLWWSVIFFTSPLAIKDFNNFVLSFSWCWPKRLHSIERCAINVLLSSFFYNLVLKKTFAMCVLYGSQGNFGWLLLKGWFPRATQTQTQALLRAMFTRPTQRQAQWYARAFGHPNIADEVEVPLGSSVLILGLWLIGRKRQIEEHRARWPKRVWVRDIFRQRKIQGDYHNCNLATESITLIVEYKMVPNYSTDSSSNVMEEDTILLSNSTREAWNEYFLHTTFPCVSACLCVTRFTRL